MDFDLSPAQREFQERSRAFAARELAPRAQDRDRLAAFPERELRAAAEHRLIGINLPAALGGQEAGAVAFALAISEIARADAAVAVTIAVSQLVGEVICRFGSEAQRRAWVPPIASGSALAASFAVTEAKAGSDLGSMATAATRTSDGWRLDGEKRWITSGDRAAVVVVGARTDPQAGKKGISAFIVPGGHAGMRAGPPEEKMGQRGSSTVPLTFTACDLPEDALLGQLGGGLSVAYSALDSGRIGIGALALGVGRAALAEATAYAASREQFGAPIASFQAIQFMLADVATELDAAELLVLRAARARELGRPVTREAAMAKLFASEAAGRACDAAIQVLGANGYSRRYPVERFARDARVTRIYEGTSEVQRIVIARALMDGLNGAAAP